MGLYKEMPRTVRAVDAETVFAQATTAWGNLPTWFRAAYEDGDVLIGATRILLHLDKGNWLEVSSGDYIICDGDRAFRVISAAKFQTAYKLVTEA
ncbi:hypothetical protein SAMN04488503_2504 [Humidesulfovibrio mexicanus]|uniref:Uncharacterized protein n=1 Tax=Humidesulfovibrio mexicanus TaxID=147047 RepID=A0A239BG61_9BACT|nr:hypothetical protein [Humidesulfovibrio mexicanus]SNS06063.1 hypothetical protein SAMN04488503_2504 [Humidesulfovibrio mexicanus]